MSDNLEKNPPQLHDKVLRSRTFKSSNFHTPVSQKKDTLSSIKPITEMSFNPQRTPAQTANRGRARGGKTPVIGKNDNLTEPNNKPTGTIPKLTFQNPTPPIISPKAQARIIEGQKVTEILNSHLNTTSMEDLCGLPEVENRFLTETLPQGSMNPNPSLIAELKRCRETIKKLTLQASTQNKRDNDHTQQHPSNQDQNNLNLNYRNPTPNQLEYVDVEPIRASASAQNTAIGEDDFSETDDSVADSQQVREIPRNRHRRREKCLMYQWPIKFKGGNGIKFLKRVERLQKSFEYDDDMVFKHFYHLLEGHALEWYWQYSDEYEDSNLAHLKVEFARVFKPRESDMSLISVMYGKKQGRESFEEFYNQMIEMNFNLKKPLPDEQLIEILRENMLDEIRQRIFTFETRDRTRFFHKANQAYFDVCNTKEKRKPVNEFRTNLNNRNVNKKVYELEFDEMAPYEIEEISTKLDKWRKKRADMKCYNCHNPDHLLINCPEPIDRFFCFKCGLEGYASPKCPNCALKFKRGAE